MHNEELHDLYFYIVYLMTLSVSRISSVNDKGINEYGSIDGMGIGRGNRSTSRKPAPVPLYPLKIIHDLTWNRIQTIEE
jgi:hypothetical protein